MLEKPWQKNRRRFAGNNNLPLNEPLFSGKYHWNDVLTTPVEHHPLAGNNHHSTIPGGGTVHKREFNFYVDDDASYISLGKMILFKYQLYKHEIPETLLRKFVSHNDLIDFARAHMKRSLSITTHPIQSEPPAITIARKVEFAFGSILALIQDEPKEEERSNDNNNNNNHTATEGATIAQHPNKGNNGYNNNNNTPHQILETNHYQKHDYDDVSRENQINQYQNANNRTMSYNYEYANIHDGVFQQQQNIGLLPEYNRQGTTMKNDIGIHDDPNGHNNIYHYSDQEDGMIYHNANMNNSEMRQTMGPLHENYVQNQIREETPNRYIHREISQHNLMGQNPQNYHESAHNIHPPYADPDEEYQHSSNHNGTDFAQQNSGPIQENIQYQTVENNLGINKYSAPYDYSQLPDNNINHGTNQNMDMSNHYTRDSRTDANLSQKNISTHHYTRDNQYMAPPFIHKNTETLSVSASEKTQMPTSVYIEPSYDNQSQKEVISEMNLSCNLLASQYESKRVDKEDIQQTGKSSQNSYNKSIDPSSCNKKISSEQSNSTIKQVNSRFRQNHVVEISLDTDNDSSKESQIREDRNIGECNDKDSKKKKKQKQKEDNNNNTMNRKSKSNSLHERSKKHKIKNIDTSHSDSSSQSGTLHERFESLSHATNFELDGIDRHHISHKKSFKPRLYHAMDIAKRKYTLARREAMATKARTKLMREIQNEIKCTKHSIVMANDVDERDAYKRYLTDLENEIEKWETLSPKHSMQITNDDNERKAYKRYLKHEEDKWNSLQATMKEQINQKVNEVIDFVDNSRSKSIDYGTESDISREHNANFTTSRESSKRKSRTLRNKLDSPIKQMSSECSFDDPKLVDGSTNYANIVAPTDMKENYTFLAKVNDTVFQAKVPLGGVRKGEVFVTPMLLNLGNDERGYLSEVNYESQIDLMHVPKGKWRDDFFDFCNDPLLWLSCFCPHIALSQIRTRLKHKIYGPHHDRSIAKFGVKSLFLFTMAFIMSHILVAYIIMREYPNLIIFLICIIPTASFDSFLFFSFLYFTIKTRKQVRNEYNIEETRCKGHEDCMTATFCNPCTISQMGRHTADYQTYREHFCTDTGLPRSVEALIPKEFFSGMRANKRSKRRDEGV